MQKWEYLYLVLEWNDEGDCMISAMNGQEVRNWERQKPFVERLQELGKEGWELVTYNPFTSSSLGLLTNTKVKSDIVRVIMKRPIE